MFQLKQEELNHLRFVEDKNLEVKYLPNVFTENGVAMLSSVLSSKTAIHINISIIRTFTKLRSFLAMEASLNERVGKLEQNSTKMFRIILERLDSIDEDMAPRLSPNRKKVGLKNE
jgi:hypothetical protein